MTLIQKAANPSSKIDVWRMIVGCGLIFVLMFAALSVLDRIGPKPSSDVVEIVSVATPPNPDETTVQVEESVSVVSEPRVNHLSPSQLIARYKQAVALDLRLGEEFIDIHRGSVLYVTFTVYGIERIGSTVSVLADDLPLFCSFEDPSSVNGIAKGDELQVLGALKNIRRNFVTLERCEVLSLSIPSESDG